MDLHVDLLLPCRHSILQPDTLLIATADSRLVRLYQLVHHSVIKDFSREVHLKGNMIMTQLAIKL